MVLKMSKSNVRFLMHLLLLLTVMVILNAHTCYSLSGNQESLEKSTALHFMEEISCIDLGAYNITLSWRLDSSIITDYFYPGHVRTFVTAHLINSDSKLELEIEFIDGELHSYYLFSPEYGTPAKKEGTSTRLIELANFVLERYGVNFNATYCNQLKMLLSKITQLDSEQKIDENDLVLRFFPSEEGASFVWCFKANNIVASKRSFCMAIEEGGVLKSLTDDWRFLKIGSAKVSLSEEEAINIALSILQTVPEEIRESQKGTVEIIQRHFNEEGAEIVSHEATLRFDKRPDDCFTLDATWSIKFHYDRTYSYHMFGFEVCIWAENGQIYEVGSQGYFGPPDGAETPNQSNLYIYGLVALILATSIVPLALTLYKKYKHSRNADQTKHYSTQPIT